MLQLQGCQPQSLGWLLLGLYKALFAERLNDWYSWHSPNDSVEQIHTKFQPHIRVALCSTQAKLALTSKLHFIHMLYNYGSIIVLLLMSFIWCCIALRLSQIYCAMLKAGSGLETGLPVSQILPHNFKYVYKPGNKTITSEYTKDIEMAHRTRLQYWVHLSVVYPGFEWGGSWGACMKFWPCPHCEK